MNISTIKSEDPTPWSVLDAFEHEIGQHRHEFIESLKNYPNMVGRVLSSVVTSRSVLAFEIMFRASHDRLIDTRIGIDGCLS